MSSVGSVWTQKLTLVQLQIIIDGLTVTVWRHLSRQKPTGYDVQRHYSQSGMRGGHFVPWRSGPSGVALVVTGQKAGWELWTECEKLEIWPAEPLAVENIAAIDSTAKCITTKSGVRMQADITRKQLAEAEYQIVQQERLLVAMSAHTGSQSPGNAGTAKRTNCPVCGWQHDGQFTQIAILGKAAFTLSGLLPDIVACVHKAHEKNFPRLSTKDDSMLRVCGGYGNPCKAFYDLKQRDAYAALFDTSRRGFIALRGFRRKESE